MFHHQGIKFESKWKDIAESAGKVLRQENLKRKEWWDLFQDISNVCNWDEKGAHKIHDELRQLIKGHINQIQERVLSNVDEASLLSAYIREWTRFFQQCNYLPLPFRVVEDAMRNKMAVATMKKDVDQSLIYKLMLQEWNDNIFQSIRDKIHGAAMRLVEMERAGESFDKQLVIGVRESYVNLSTDHTDPLRIYKEHFERKYLESTDNYYRAHASSYLAANGVLNYLKYADGKLAEEELRGKQYLETQKSIKSVELLKETLVRCLVDAFKDPILAECPRLIRENNIEYLRLMFMLIDRVPGAVQAILNHLEDFIYQAGLDDMRQCADTITTDSEKYVEELLKLFNRFSTLVSQAFNSDTRFLTSRDKAYKKVVNDTTVFRIELPTSRATANKTAPESKCPELLALFCDQLLRKSPLSKKMSPQEIEEKLKNLLLVLKYVQNKDVFMKYHKSHLTRRLILETSVDSELEESMVEWLRDIGMPVEFVNKLARMFQDIKVSEDLNQRFKENLHDIEPSTAESVNIKILNAAAWSRGSDYVPVALPSELDEYIPSIEDFYKKSHTGRKLQWHHLLSNGTVTFQNAIGTFELEVTTFQMSILFAFNQRPLDQISFESLKLATQLPDTELRRTLWSLVSSMKMKLQVLKMEPAVKTFKDFDNATLFSINQNFGIFRQNKLQKRGKLSLVGKLILTTEKAKKEEEEGIVQLRILRIQEAIVKIMKMRKKVNNAALQTELVEILKNMFLPQKKMIKEQIEWLIEHKYMQRDEENINTFIYLA